MKAKTKKIEPIGMVEICLDYKGTAKEIKEKDKAINIIMKKYKAKNTGTGYFLPSGPRDMQFDITEDKAKEALKEIKKLKFVKHAHIQDAIPF